MTSIAEDIFARLGGASGQHHGETYTLTEGNRITVLDTPGWWGRSGSDNGYWLSGNRLVTTPHCQKLLDEIESVVAGARTCLDITTLYHTHTARSAGRFPSPGFPDLYFFDALKRGFKKLNDSGARPLIRILIGMPLGPVVSVGDMHNWLNQLLPAGSGLTVYMATNHTHALNSWNHAKIVAADGRSAIVGGHNLWHSAYMTFAPVHDVSARVDGPAAQAAHGFCNVLWTHPQDSIKWHAGKYDVARPTAAYAPAGPSAGGARMLALGRLGSGLVPHFNINSNASVFARVTALLRAQSNIRISQQSLGFQGIQTDYTSFDVATLAALANAMMRGVKVTIVLSNDGAEDAVHDPYSGSSFAETVRFLALFFEYQAAVGFPPANRPEDYFSIDSPLFFARLWAHLPTAANSQRMMKQLSIATLKFWQGGGNWSSSNETRIPGNHAKVYIIDDTHFYVGSDNMYRSGTNAGLQEFGYLVEGQRETREFITTYWDKLWQYSKIGALSGTPVAA